MDFWAQNIATPGLHVVIDMGCVDRAETREAADRLLSKVKARNLLIVGGGGRRLVVRIPARQVADVLASFGEIRAGAGYAGCTHKWHTGAAPQGKAT